MIPPSLHSTAAGIARFIPHIAKIKPYAAALGQPSERWLTSGFFSRAQRSALYTTDIRERLAGCEEQPAKRAAFMHTANLDRLSQLQYHDLTVYLPGDIIVKVDRASMMNSLEVRSPLLDHKVFEFMARVPPQHRVSLTNGKTLLKRALADKLPQSVQRRKKQGFSIPQSEWLRSPLKPMLEDLLANSSSLDLFNRAYIERLIREHSDGVCDHKDRLWALLCFELWHHQQ